MTLLVVRMVLAVQGMMLESIRIKLEALSSDLPTVGLALVLEVILMVLSVVLAMILEVWRMLLLILWRPSWFG